MKRSKTIVASSRVVHRQMLQPVSTFLELFTGVWPTDTNQSNAQLEMRFASGVYTRSAKVGRIRSSGLPLFENNAFRALLAVVLLMAQS